jgi:hypothetical protein
VPLAFLFATVPDGALPCLTHIPTSAADGGAARRSFWPDCADPARGAGIRRLLEIRLEYRRLPIKVSKVYSKSFVDLTVVPVGESEE